jgi:adhesin transport system outer membrane protein
MSATSAVAPRKQIEDALIEWNQAWLTKDVVKYVNFYAPLFKTPIDATHGKWLSRRERRIAEKKQIAIEIADLEFGQKDTNHATTTFHQKYSSDIYSDVVRKTLEWERIEGRWLIVKESPEPL